MAKYVDGFVIPIKTKDLPAYLKMAKAAKVVWLDHGALDYVEAVGEDLEPQPGCGLGFPKGVQTKKGETVLFSYVVYRSRAHRDKVNKKVMADPRLAEMMKGGMPFDVNRMLCGGFKAIVEV
jgi:uncharacterized protein YbaA (DUF1428 family)